MLSYFGVNKDLFNKSCELSLDINSEKEDISVSRSRVFFVRHALTKGKSTPLLQTL